MTKNTVSPFNWQGPSQIDWKHGKTERQMLLDATRKNKTTFLGAHGGIANALKSKNPVSSN